jgi:hypothetical protein
MPWMFSDVCSTTITLWHRDTDRRRRAIGDGLTLQTAGVFSQVRAGPGPDGIMGMQKPIVELNATAHLKSKQQHQKEILEQTELHRITMEASDVVPARHTTHTHMNECAKPPSLCVFSGRYAGQRREKRVCLPLVADTYQSTSLERTESEHLSSPIVRCKKHDKNGISKSNFTWRQSEKTLSRFGHTHNIHG